ncbi:MAG: 50S ribosomal protein L11 methyltransferase [Thermodesulfovibrionales bacterium]
MTYYEVTITVPAESKDALVNRLTEMGCLGVTDLEEKIIAYFDGTCVVEVLKEGLYAFREVLKASGLDPDFAFECVNLPDKDWNEIWKKNIKPIDVAGIFLILPSWEKEQPDRINLVIDAGMVFGTGHHHTTQSCLLLIKRYMDHRAKERFLDVGTGTGILAICASKLGFREVVAVDIDPLAVEASPRNVSLNRLDNITIREGGITVAEGTYDFIAGNLLSEIIISIVPEIAARLKDSGTVLLSGIMLGQEDEVIARMEQAGLKCVEKVVADIWVSLVFRRGL